MSFGNPWALLLLAPAPLFFLVSRKQLIHLSALRRGVAIALRLTIFVLLVLALADARWLRSADDLSVVFLLDHSDSMGNASKEAAQTFIREALAEKLPDDTAGIIVFGANAVVEESPRKGVSLAGIASAPDTGYTNAADAVRLGMALFPPGSPKRLVLVSDGQNNLGDARAAAQLAAAAGIELSTLEIPAQTGPEVRLQTLSLPSTLYESEQFDLELAIESNLATATEVQIYADGQLIAQEPVTVRPGENRYLFPMMAGAQGFSTFQARLAPAQDTQTPNNRLDAFSLVEGPLRVLVASVDPAEAAPLVSALDAAGLRPELVAPHQIPSDLPSLSDYAVAVLVNLPATALSPAQIELLQVYVRDLGRGLVAVGGPDSYGPGGYFQTPLEETLPVEMALKDRERLPGMSMFMVIDKSGSMDSAGTMGMGGPRKVELAKEAIYRAVDFLAPWDRVGVVAFDNAARWVVRPEGVVNVGGIKDRVGTIRASGGTDILAGLSTAAGAMVEEESRVRHIILLTDGGADPTGIPELVDDLVAVGVSISVVAIGDDAAPFLKDLAERGNGRFHLARDAGTIPQIFAQEATLALKAYLIEEEFTPKLTAPSPVLQGITALPNLRGYVATTAKQTAQTVLVTHQDDPLLAQWQYGLGRSVAWTSDATGRWAVDWLGWADFARFWGQTVRWTIVEAAGGNLETQVALDRERGVYRLTVEALDSAGNFLNDLRLQGTMVAPDLTSREISLAQVGPGLYQADLKPEEMGAYLLQILGRENSDEGGKLVSSATRGFVVNYSPEYAADNDDPTLMADLAELGGGQTLSMREPGVVFAHTLPPVSGSRPLWPALLTAFVLILPLDVGVRRVIVGREEWLKLAKRLRGYLPQPAATDVVSTAPSSVRSLLSIKKSDDEPAQRDVTSTADPASVARSPLIVNRPTKPEPLSSPAPESPSEPEPGDRMSRLLNAKRKAKK